jgi:hypothetical protein
MYRVLSERDPKGFLKGSQKGSQKVPERSLNIPNDPKRTKKFTPKDLKDSALKCSGWLLGERQNK